jgi:carbamate kinase
VNKDRASSLLARTLEADHLFIAIEADGVFDDWGGSHPRLLERLTASEARAMAAREDTEQETIAPKLVAAAEFAEHGREAIICGGGSLEAALRGDAGTRVIPDPA